MWSAIEKRRQPARDLLRLASDLARLGGGPLGRAWIWAAVLLVPVKQHLGRLGRFGLPLWLHVGGRRRPFRFRDHSELMALKEIFVDGEYGFEPPREPRTILDLGANVGQAALYFRSRFPAARIVSVEPASESFSLLARNLGGDPGIELRQCAVTGRDGTVQLRKYHLSWINRVSSERVDDPRALTEDVDGLSLGSLLDAAGMETVDLVKADIEGLEYDVFVDSPALHRVGTLVGEVHEREIPVDSQTFVERLQADGGFDSHRFLKPHIFMLERAQPRQER
jgi:FkbM family methyltransferase